MNEVLVADKQRISYNQLMNEVIPKFLKDASYIKDSRYSINFELYPIDSVNVIEENGFVYTNLKTCCTIEDFDTNEKQTLVIDLLKVPVFLELGFMIGGNYKQVLDIYDKPAGWSFSKEVKYDAVSQYETNTAKLMSANYKTLTIENDKQAPYIRCSKRSRGANDNNDTDRIPVSVFFRALTGYKNSELLELFGYDNPYNTLAFSDNPYMALTKTTVKGMPNTRAECIEFVYNSMFGSGDAAEKGVEEKYKRIENWFFKKSYMNLGKGNKKRFDYTMSFKNRALNKILAEDVKLLSNEYKAGTILTTSILTQIDNSPINVIKVEYEDKIHSLRKFSTFTFRALDYYLAEDIDCDGVFLKAGTKLSLEDLNLLNGTSLEVIKACAKRGSNQEVLTFKRNADGSILTIEDIFTAYSIFANNMNGYNYVNDIDELTDKIVVPFDQKVINLIEINLNNFINRLNNNLEIIETNSNAKIIDALSDFSDVINKNALLEAVSNVDNTESQLSDINNVMSFLAKDFKVTNKSSGNTTTEGLIGVHSLQFGRLDPYDSPESGKIGKVHHRTILAKEDENGYLLAPYVVVHNGEITDRVEYLSAAEEKDLYIAEWNETFRNDDGSIKERVKVRYKGEISFVDVNDVMYKEYSSIQSLSPTTGSIPFLNFAAGKRIQMSDNQQKQAVSVPSAERPLVCTGIESLLGVGVYKAKDLLNKYYDEQVYNCKQLEEYKEEILNSDLQLTRIISTEELRKLTLYVVATKDINLPINKELTLDIPFAQHTLKSDMYSYRINSSKGGLFTCNDIIAYNSSYDIKEYELSGVMDYGALQVDESQLQGSIALGHNYCVAFKTMESSSIDDGIVISSAIVADDTITSIMIYKETVELLNTDTRTEVFEAPSDKANGEPVLYFNRNGLPKIGTYLYPGDAVVYKKVSEGAGLYKKSSKYRATSLGRYHEGQVISTNITKTTSGATQAEVYLACRATGEVADKFAGRIGNKGVVAKIVPEEMMPYDPETGRTIELILNPLGVPSRMNITQLLEVTLAAAASKENKIAIISPFHPNSLDYVLDAAKQADIKPIKLIDGRTGKYFEREINVGYQYMYKLVHMARKNIHAVGLQHGVNQVTLQAKSSAKLNGGQSFGEMESWCLEGIGAMKVLQELQTTLSDDRIARANLDRQLKNDPYYVDIMGENHNDAMMTTLLRLLGTDVRTQTDSTGEMYYEFLPLTDETIKSYSVMNVTKDSLHSSDIFGTNSDLVTKMRDREKWGWIDLHTEIVHPTWIEKGELGKLIVYVEPKKKDDLKKSDSDIKWSASLTFSQSILSKLKDCEVFAKCIEDLPIDTVKIISSKQYKYLNDDSKMLYKTGFEAISFIFRHYDLKKALAVISLKITNRSSAEDSKLLTIEEMKAISRNASVEEARSKSLQAFVDKLCDVITDDVTDAYEYYEQNGTLYTALNNYKAIKEFMDSGSSLTDYLITSYPVMPAIYRPNMEIQGRPTKNDFDAQYEAIINAAEFAKNSDSQIAKIAVYKAICNFTGITSDVRGTKKTYNTVLGWFVGKNQNDSNNKHHGKIRETVQKKIIGRSGRAVIIPSQDPSRGPMYIGLPFSMAVVMYEEQLIPYLRSFGQVMNETNKIGIKSYRNLFLAIATNNIIKFNEIYTSEFQSCYQIPLKRARVQFIEWIRLFIEGSNGQAVGPSGIILEPQVVIAGRQPSLHRYSIRAYYPIIVFTKAIQVNSLVCSGYNADFDGDQMWVAALLSKSAMDEAMALMSAKSDIINPKNGEIILTHSQDIALGIYVMTMFEKNALEPKDKSVKYFYDNMELLRTDILDGNIHSWENVAYSTGNKTFVSTAGRVLFNSIIPDGFSADIGSFTNKYQLDIDKPERFAELKYDGLITSGKSADNITSYKLSSICKELYENTMASYTAVRDSSLTKLLDIYQELTDIGFRMSDRHSVSISIFDFREIADKSNKGTILANAESKQNLIEKDYYDGLLSDTDKARCISSLYSKAFSDIEEDIFGGNGKNSIIDRNNNIFIMYDSGARGSKGQIMQSIGAVGSLQKTKNENLELPVISNYSEGLSSFDFQMISYSTRTGMASTQNETKNSGYASRRAEHCTSGLEISELDCGKSDWWYDIQWGDRIDSLSRFIPTKKWFYNNLLGEIVDQNDIDTMQLFSGTLDNGRLTEESFECLSNGFNTIQLNDRTISVSTDMLIGTKILDNDSLKYLKNFNKSGYFTRDGLQIVDKRHLKHLTTDIGVFEFRYQLSELSKSLLINREARNIPGLRLYTGPLSRRLRTPMYIMTPAAVKWIEESGTERIEARILLDCETGNNDNGDSNKSLHSCCARCYGLKYTSNALPEVGENVGIEAAQAIGEPAAQLTLSLVNKGGATGESVASGVEILHKLLDGTNIFTDKQKEKTIVSKMSGYLDIELLDKKAKLNLITENGDVLGLNSFASNCSKNVNTRINPKSIIRLNNEWINAGEAITAGYVLPRDVIKIPENDQIHLIRAKQIVWLNNWFQTFYDSNIIINARHFELFTKAQMSDMTVIASDNKLYKVGQKYKISDITSAGPGVKAILDVNNCKDTILNSSGALAVLSYENIMATLPSMAQKHYRSYRNSPTGALNLGENLVTKSKKFIYTKTHIIHDSYEIIDNEADYEFIMEENTTSNKIDLTSINFDDALFDEMPLDNISSVKEEMSPEIEDTSLLDEYIVDNTDSEINIENMNEIQKPQISKENLINMQEMDLFGDTKYSIKYAILDITSYEPVPNLDIALLRDGDIIDNSHTDEYGNCIFSNIDNGDYVVKILSDKVSGSTEKEITIDFDSIDELWEVELMVKDNSYNPDSDNGNNLDDEFSDNDEDDIDIISDFYDEDDFDDEPRPVREKYDKHKFNKSQIDMNLF